MTCFTVVVELTVMTGFTLLFLFFGIILISNQVIKLKKQQKYLPDNAKKKTTRYEDPIQ